MIASTLDLSGKPDDGTYKPLGDEVKLMMALRLPLVVEEGGCLLLGSSDGSGGSAAVGVGRRCNGTFISSSTVAIAAMYLAFRRGCVSWLI